jgi:hypothetical protein
MRAEPDSLASAATRRLGAERLRSGQAALRRLFGVDLPAPDGARLEAVAGAPESVEPDVFHMGLAEACLHGFDWARDGWEGLARAQAELLPDSPEVGAICARAAELFDRPDGELVERAAELFEVVEHDPASLAALAPSPGPGPRHAHARENHGYWESFTHTGLAEAADPRLAVFLGRRKAHLDRYRTVTDRYRACGFPRLHLAALRRFAGLTTNGEAAAAQRIALDGPGRSLGIGVYNGDVTFARTLAQPLAPVPRGALPGLMACLETVFPAARRLRLADGAATRQFLLERRLRGFVAASTLGAEAVVFVVPPHLRRIVLDGAGVPQHRLLVPGSRVHELWPVVLADLLGRAEALFARHRRLTVFVQAGSMGLPIVAALHGLAQERPALALRCYDLGQVLDSADPALIGTGRLARHAAAAAAQRLPFRMQENTDQPRA